MTQSVITEDLSTVINIANRAGEILMRYWKTNIGIEYKKQDLNDPVTRADQESDDLIRKELLRRFSPDTVLSEEHDSTPENYDGRVWMVDPMDDTTAFTKGFDSFSVSIGCVENGTPKIGVVLAPARQLVYFAQKGLGAFLKTSTGTKSIHTSVISNLSQARIIVGLPIKARRSLDDVVTRSGGMSFIEDGSIALAMARIAAGDAECTICTNPRVSKWDSAGGQAVLEEAGGIVTDMDGIPLDYKHAGRGWPRLVVASANLAVHTEFIAAIRK